MKNFQGPRYIRNTEQKILRGHLRIKNYLTVEIYSSLGESNFGVGHERTYGNMTFFRLESNVTPRLHDPSLWFNKSFVTVCVESPGRDLPGIGILFLTKEKNC